jgi:hypothetical protein
MPVQPPLVLIEWLDSGHPVPGWTWIGSAGRQQPHRCVSAGFLVQDDHDAKVLVANLGSKDNTEVWDQASGVIVIPAKAIIKIERFAPPSSRAATLLQLTVLTGQRPAA